MKVIILAAGRGSRMVPAFNGPKPLIKVNGKVLLWWALQSFHELLTCGLIAKSDIKIAILSDQVHQFKKENDISEFFGEIDPYVEISRITSGPLETAALTVTHLFEIGALDESETLVFSDSDHFAKSIAIRRSFEQEKEVYLWETQKEPGLEWGFINRRSNPPQIVEKPKSSDGLDTSKGVVGIYGFLHASQFVRFAREMLENQQDSERFMSDVVNLMIAKSASVSIQEIVDFFPMGTPSQITNAKNLPNPDFLILDSPNYFIDLDGVLLEHNDTVHGNQTWDLDKPILENIKELNEAYKSSRIVIVTARPKKHLDEIIEILKRNGINFDEVIAGCTGGIRLLVNDRKPRMPFMDTSISVNTLRDGPLQLRSINPSVEDISGGSGAKTLLIGGSISRVVKYTTNRENANILSYQAKWYKFCKMNTHAQTLDLLEVHAGEQGYFGYTTKYRTNLTSLDFYKLSSGDTRWEEILVDGFKSLYTINEPSNEVDEELLGYVIRDKVLPSIEISLKKWQLHQILSQELTELKKKFETFTTSSAFSQFHFRGDKAFIHGDPTFENLQVDSKQSKIVFIDPVGKMIEPSKNDYENSSHLTYPVFDLARLELSFKMDYERHMRIAKSAELGPEECISIAQSSMNNMSILQTRVESIFSSYFIKNLDIVLATTIGRILKYKENEKEVLILAVQANSLLNGIT